MKNTLICAIVFFISGCSTFNFKQNSIETYGGQVVYKHDKGGNPISGNLETLINGIRSGYSVRVGWGWEKNIRGSQMKLEHVAEPVFLSIIQDNLVSAVIDPHPLLENYLNLENQSFRKEGEVWQSILTTNGSFNAMIFSRTTGELIKDWPQRQMMTWYLEYPLHLIDKITEPLYRNGSTSSS